MPTAADKDFVLLAADWFLSQKVTVVGADGVHRPGDGSYQQQGAETVYVFAEFLRDKGLLHPGVDVARRPDLELRFAQLTETGQAFTRAALDKWMRSLDRDNRRAIDASGLERRWAKFQKG